MQCRRQFCLKGVLHVGSQHPPWMFPPQLRFLQEQTDQVMWETADAEQRRQFSLVHGKTSITGPAGSLTSQSVKSEDKRLQGLKTEGQSTDGRQTGVAQTSQHSGIRDVQDGRNNCC